MKLKANMFYFLCDIFSTNLLARDLESNNKYPEQKADMNFVILGFQAFNLLGMPSIKFTEYS